MKNSNSMITCFSFKDANNSLAKQRNPSNYTKRAIEPKAFSYLIILQIVNLHPALILDINILFSDRVLHTKQLKVVRNSCENSTIGNWNLCRVLNRSCPAPGRLTQKHDFVSYSVMRTEYHAATPPSRQAQYCKIK